MFHSNWKEVEGVIYFFAKFQSEFIFSVYLKVNILEGEHVALDGKELGVYFSSKHSERFHIYRKCQLTFPPPSIRSRGSRNPPTFSE